MWEARTRRARRYYLLAVQAYRQLDIPGIVAVNRGQQEAESAILLPADFPALCQLQRARYFSAEDIDGAEPWELVPLEIRQTDITAAFAYLRTLGYGQPYNLTFDPWRLILKPLSSVAGPANGTTPTLDMGAAKAVVLTLDVETADGTSPLLGVEIQTSSDQLSWTDLASFSASTDGTQTAQLSPERYVRALWTTSGNDSSIAFSLTGKTRFSN